MNIDWKVILPALGLFGLAIYQISTGDYSHAVTTFFAALAAFGVKAGFDRTYAVMDAQNKQIIDQNNQILASQTKK